jgi:predicted small lipoprotein YifL
VNRRAYRPLVRLALIGALMLALGLGACGRKGPLEAPPGSTFNFGARSDAKPVTTFAERALGLTHHTD